MVSSGYEHGPQLMQPCLFRPHVDADSQKIEANKQARLNFLIENLRHLIGADVYNTHLGQEWITTRSTTQHPPWDMFHILDIWTGYPSAMMPNLQDACSHSPVYKKHRDNMKETRNVCN